MQVFYVAVLALRYGITEQDPCELAYQKYAEHHQRAVTARGEALFCKNFKQLLADLPGCPECDVTTAFDVYDRDAPALPRQRAVKVNQEAKLLDRLMGRKKATKQECYTSIICGVDDGLETLGQIPQSVFLMEHGLETPAKDQGQCGGCWAFTTTAMLETAVLNDAWWYSANLPFWNKTAGTLDLSELYILANVAGFNDRCEGGNVVTSFNYMQAFNTSIEMESNAPYSQWPSYRTSGTVPNTLALANRITPFTTWNVQGYGDIPVTIASYVSSGTPTTKDISAMRSYLARGIALSVQISTSTNSRLSSYTGTSYITGDCGEVDHAVTVVGYGKKDGVDVWVIKNSWGQDFGYEGHFYVPVGQNAFCVEELASAIVPKHYNNFTIPAGKHSRGSTKQLDEDDGALVTNDGTYAGYKKPFPTYGVILIVLGVVVVLVATIICCCNKQHHRQNVPMNYYAVTGQMR